MQKYDFTLPPGAAYRISVQANYLRIVSVTALPALLSAIPIKVTNDAADEFIMFGASQIRLDKDAISWVLTNTTASTLTVQVMIGKGEYQDASIQLSGSVSLNDQGIIDTSANDAFVGVGTVQASGTQFATIALKNNGAQTIYLDRLGILVPETVTQVAIGYLATGNPTGLSQNLQYNRNLGGPAGGGQIWEGQLLTAPTVTTTIAKVFPPSNIQSGASNGDYLEWVTTGRPFRIPAGSSLLVYNLSGWVNSGALFQAVMEWREL